MKFIIQTIDNKVTLDFCFELERALEYWTWRGEPFTLAYTSLEDLSPSDYPDYVPVGTIEFVKAFSGFDLKPINIPAPLLANDSWTGGAWVGRVSELPDRFKGVHPLYVKSTVSLKSDVNGIVSDLTTLDPNQDYQFRLPLNVLSEWRCFVSQGEIIACQPYSGDPLVFPEAFKMKRAVKVSGIECPAYTMDFAVIKNKDGMIMTVVMEAHELISCGLYGFSDYQKLPLMLKRAWDYVKGLNQS